MEQQLLQVNAVSKRQKGAKRRKRSISQILREAYQCHAANDREAQAALRSVLGARLSHG